MTATRAEAVTSRAGALHQSTIDSITEGCSWQWGLTNILGLYDPPKPASEAGTAVHAGIEAHELERKKWFDSDGTEGNQAGLPLEDLQVIARAHLDTVTPEIPAHLFPVNKKTGDRLDLEGVYALASNALEAWYSVPPKGADQSNREYLLDLRPLEIEPYFNEKLLPDTRPLGGWIDGVYLTPGGKIRVIDQKTAKDFTRWKPGSHRLQGTAYTIGVLLDPRFPVDLLTDIEFVYSINRTTVGKTKSFERARLMEFVPSLEDVQDLGVLMRQAEQVIANEEFVRNPGWGPLCSRTYCPFFEGCMVTGELNKPFKQLKLEVLKK